jgi:phospholipase/carboxylesterase
LAGTGILQHELYVPGDVASGVPVLLLLHGRGSHRGDLFRLQRQLPAAWAVVAPDAPWAAAPWGYGPGYAWYRYMGGTVPEAASFTASLQALDRLLDALPALLGVTPRHIALGGFSQGGTVSVGYALSRPGRVGHVLNFSGFLADHPEVRVIPSTVAGARFFWGHGTADPNIPFELGVAGRSQLAAAGANLEARDYPIGHWIDPAELADSVAWLRRGFAAG